MKLPLTDPEDRRAAAVFLRKARRQHPRTARRHAILQLYALGYSHVARLMEDTR